MINNLTVIIPSIRNYSALESIKSAFDQIGFNQIIVILSGKSTRNTKFVNYLRKNFSEKKLYIAKCVNKPQILPGEARNDGLRLITKNKLKPDYILFLDDDVVIPNDYCLKLCEFKIKSNSAAVMGNIESKPRNIWTTIVDYSNFWWLQTNTNRVNNGWLATTATLLKYSDLKDLFFLENIAVNEDVIFFNELSKITQKPLSICTNTKAFHFHERKNFKEVVKYQFNNGYKGVLFHNQRLSLINAIKDIKLNYTSSYKSNKKFLNNHHLINLGVLISFVIFEFGIQCSLISSSLTKIKKKSKNIVKNLS